MTAGDARPGPGRGGRLDATPMNALYRAVTGMLERVEDGLAWLTYAALFLMMSMNAIDAIGRYFQQITPPDVYHLTELFLMPVVFFFALAQTQRDRGHVNVILLSQFLPLRLQAAINAFVFGATALVCAVIAYSSWDAAWPHLAQWRVTGGMVPWPTGISRAIVPIGMGLLTLRLIVDTVVDARTAITGRGADGGRARPAGEAATGQRGSA